MRAVEQVQTSPAAVLVGGTTEVVLPEPLRQELLTDDVARIAKLVREYQGDLVPVMTFLQQHHGNAFVQEVVATKRRSLWQRIKGLRDGQNKLAEASVAGADGKTPAKDGQATGDDAETAGQLDPQDARIRDAAARALGTDAEQAGDAAEATTAVTETGVAGLDVDTSAVEAVQVFGTRVALHSRQFTHELFGETVTARFHVGLDAKVFSETKNKLGLDVRWNGFGAEAHLAGAGNTVVGLTGAATLVWAKQSSSAYAQKIAQGSSWRGVVGSLVPGWVMNRLSDERVSGWLQHLVELVISGEGSEAVVLGASTTATARGDLGLPNLAFEGGSLHCKGGAGLSFGGARGNIDLELGRARGLELLSILAFRGSGGLFQRLAPSISIPAFIRERLGGSENDFAQDSAPATGRGKLKNGNNRLLDWSHNKDAASKDALTKGEGHDFAFTRGNGEDGGVRTGDDARAHHAEVVAQQNAAAEAQAAGGSGKLKSLADKALGGERKLVHHEKKQKASLIEEATVEFGAARAIHGEVKGQALEATVAAGGDIGISADRLRVGGNAHASAYLIAGQVHIATPDLPLEFLGERVIARFNFGVDAGAFAEANGNVNVDVGWKGAGVDASISGFAGIKAGLSASGTLKWQRKAPAQYANQIVGTGAWRSMFGGAVPNWMLNRVPDKKLHGWMESLIGLLLHGGEGEALVLGAAARAEGAVGIGGAASFSAGFRGGVLHCHGRGGLTFGLGAGAHVDLALGLIDGMGLLGILTLRGTQEVGSLIKPGVTIQQHVLPLVKKMLRGDH
jgi:hypothetical protein